MMTWTNILKKAVNFGLVGVVAGMVLFSAGGVEASSKAQCIGKNYTPPHNQKSTMCSTNRCADAAGSGISTDSWKSVKNKTQGSCLNQMPIGSGRNINVSSIPGVRTDKNRNGDGTRNHEGVDVGTAGQRNVPIYAAAAGTVVSSLPGSSYKANLNPGKVTTNGKRQTCTGGLTRIILQHKRGATTQKNCEYFYTAYLHAEKIFVREGQVVGRGAQIATAGGCSDYDIHMHYEIRDCDGTIYSPLCTEGQSSPQKLCDGSTDIVPPAASDGTLDCSQFAMPSQNYSDCLNLNAAIKTSGTAQLEDCGKFKTGNSQKAALAKCEAMAKNIPSILRTDRNPDWKKYTDCKKKANSLVGEANAFDANQKYQACLKRNQLKQLAANNFYGYWGDNGGSGVQNDESKIVDFQSNYKCNLAENYSSFQGCMLCEPFKVIFNTASSIAQKCHNKFAKSMKKLLGIGLAIWLAWLVMKYVSDMTVKDPGMMLNEIFKQVFIVAFLVLLLNLDVARFFEIFVSPVFEAGFKFATITMGNTTIGNYAGVDGSGLPASMGNSMLTAIESVETRLEKLMALGSNAMCTAFYIKSYHGYPFFPHLGYLITGLFLWVIGMVFMVIYPFLLIDSVLQFTIASSLLPVALASTAFKPTYKYLNIFKVVQTFMTAMFVFIFLTIILFILLTGIDKTVSPIIKDTYEASTSFFSLDGIVWYGEKFIKLVFFLFLGKTVLDDIPQFADKFASAISLGQGMAKADMGIGRKMGGLYAGAATNTAIALGKPALSAGLKGVKATGRATGMVLAGLGEEVKDSSISNIRSARYNYLMHVTARKMEAAEQNGGASGAFVHGKDYRGRKVSRRVVTNEDGTQYLESSRTALLSGNVTTIKQNELLALKTKEYKDGSMRETYEVMPSFAKSLFNRDGTKNRVALNAFMNSQGFTEKEKNKIILNQMLKQRMPNNKAASLEGKFKSETVNSYLDKQGRKVFEVRRTDKDGNISVFRRTEGGERDLIEFEQIKKKDGKAKKLSSDGILQKKETYQYDMNQDGTMNMNEEIPTTINGAEIKDTQVTADGLMIDKDGQVLGKVLANGNIIDHSGKVIGTTEVPDLAFDQTGKALGKITAQGTVVDQNGNVTGIIGPEGQILDKNDNVIGRVSSEHMAQVFNHSGIRKNSRKVEFSNAKSFKGRRIFDDDGRLDYSMRNEELMFEQSDLELYKMQMKKYGDVLQHNEFGR